MNRQAAERCPTPPHSHHAIAATEPTDDEAAPDGLLRVAARATFRWFRAAPAERVPLLGAPALYGSAALVHAYQLPWWGIGLVSVTGTIATYAAGMNRLTGWRVGGLTAATATSGAWLATSATLGPAAGPNGLLTWLFLGAYSAGYALYRIGLRTPPQTVAGEPPRIDWESYLSTWGLDGATVITAEPTRLGERVLLNTKGTGKLASAFNRPALGERIAEDFDLPVGRVDVQRPGIAGQLQISLRLIDPWAQPIKHPMLDMDSEIRLTEVEDARTPLIIGQDPETGSPLTLTVWDEDGASHIMIVAIKGGGKTVLLNNILERVTAADNAVVWGIDVSKGKDLRRWRDKGALGLSACGSGERAKAVRILEQAARTVAWREANSSQAVFEPRPGHPLIVVVVDEIDVLVAGGDMLAQRAVAALKTITSKGRSASVGAILVGQRGTAAWMGGADIRANIDRFCLLKTGRTTEVMNAVGDLGINLPNITAYGEGKAGVVLITDISGNYNKGRSFKLKDLDDIDLLAVGRRPSPLEPDLAAHLGEAYAKLQAGVEDKQPTLAEVDDVPSTAEDRAAERAAIKASLRLIATPDAEIVAKVREHSAARWAIFQHAEQAAVSPILTEVRARILAVLADGPAAKQDIATRIGYSDAHTVRLLNHLRAEGAIDVHGRGPATRWYLKAGEHIA